MHVAGKHGVDSILHEKRLGPLFHEVGGNLQTLRARSGGVEVDMTECPVRARKQAQQFQV